MSGGDETLDKKYWQWSPLGNGDVFPFVVFFVFFFCFSVMILLPLCILHALPLFSFCLWILCAVLLYCCGGLMGGLCVETVPNGPQTQTYGFPSVLYGEMGSNEEVPFHGDHDGWSLVELYNSSFFFPVFLFPCFRRL